MGVHRIPLIAILVVIGGLGSVLGGLSHESIEIGQVYFGADEIVDLC